MVESFYFEPKPSDSRGSCVLLVLLFLMDEWHSCNSLSSHSQAYCLSSYIPTQTQPIGLCILHRYLFNVPYTSISNGLEAEFQNSCLENPWTEEPGRLPSIGLQRVRHDWSNLACTHISRTAHIIQFQAASHHFLILSLTYLSLCLSFHPSIFPLTHTATKNIH